MSGALGPSNLGAMNGSDVHSTLREMWETRPARPREGRQIAGVAAAIARRYDIDPVLVRVGFVVAAFYGIGAALYIAGWVLLPDEPGPAINSGRRRPKALLLILLGIAAVAGLGGMTHAHTGVVLPIVAVAVLLFLLHRSRSDRGVAGPRPTPAAGTAEGRSAGGASAARRTPCRGRPPRDGPLDLDLVVHRSLFSVLSSCSGSVRSSNIRSSEVGVRVLARFGIHSWVRTANREQRTLNRTPNTNREQRTEKRERLCS